MKKIIAFLLTICLCMALFAACDKPADNSNAAGNGQTEYNNTENSESTEGSGDTESSGNTENSDANDDSTGNSGETGSNNTQDNSQTSVKGERITEDQFNKLINEPPTNFTYTEVRTYNGKVESITKQISGEEYTDTIVSGDTVTRRLLGILVDGKVKKYQYNEETSKWESASVTPSTNYPLEGFHIPLSEFTYDETTGIYIYSITNEDATAQLHLAFKDGNCVYLAQFVGEDQSITTFCDYGTTVIPVPDADSIVESDSGKNSTIQDSSSEKH